MEHKFVYKDSKSDKFWNIKISEDSFTVTYGKTGTAGQTQTTEFDSEEKCRKEADKLLNEKLKKGYTKLEDEEKSSSSEGNHMTRIKIEMLKSFKYFSDEKHTGSTDPISKILFGAQGPVVDPPDYEFTGFGWNKDGRVFENVGGINFDDVITADLDDEEAYKQEFDQACSIAIEALKELAPSKEFKAIPKTGPISFALSIMDQLNRVLGRIHPDGKFETAPKKVKSDDDDEGE